MEDDGAGAAAVGRGRWWAGAAGISSAITALLAAHTGERGRGWGGAAGRLSAAGEGHGCEGGGVDWAALDGGGGGVASARRGMYSLGFLSNYLV